MPALAGQLYQAVRLERLEVVVDLLAGDADSGGESGGGGWSGGGGMSGGGGASGSW